MVSVSGSSTVCGWDHDCTPYERCLFGGSVCKRDYNCIRGDGINLRGVFVNVVLTDRQVYPPLQYKFSWYMNCNVYGVFNHHIVFAVEPSQSSRDLRHHRFTSHRSHWKKLEEDIRRSCIVWVWQSKNTPFQVVALWLEGKDLSLFHFLSILLSTWVTWFSLRKQV